MEAAKSGAVLCGGGAERRPGRGRPPGEECRPRQETQEEPQQESQEDLQEQRLQVLQLGEERPGRPQQGRLRWDRRKFFRSEGWGRDVLFLVGLNSRVLFESTFYCEFVEFIPPIPPRHPLARSS